MRKPKQCEMVEPNEHLPPEQRWKRCEQEAAVRLKGGYYEHNYCQLHAAQMQKADPAWEVLRT